MAEPFNRSNTKCKLYQSCRFAPNAPTWRAVSRDHRAPSTLHVLVLPLPHHDVRLKDLHIAVHRLLQRHEGVFGGQLSRKWCQHRKGQALTHLAADSTQQLS